jgi:hypothetical protein
MRRRSLVLTVIAGFAVFLVVLALYMPASWFASMLPPQVRCKELGGSIWQGECLGLAVQGANFGDATWNLKPLRALSGRLAGDVDVHGAALNLRADVDTSFAGVGTLGNVDLNLLLDPALLPLPQQPRGSQGNLRGTVTAKLRRVEIVAGPAPRTIDGVIELHDFQQAGAQPQDLGSYQVSFDGSPPKSGALVGKLKDLGGPFMVDGTLTLSGTNSYLVQGFITGRTADAESTVRDITLGVPPDASGRSTFSFEGTY